MEIMVQDLSLKLPQVNLQKEGEKAKERENDWKTKSNGIYITKAEQGHPSTERKWVGEKDKEEQWGAKQRTKYNDTNENITYNPPLCMLTKKS